MGKVKSAIVLTLITIVIAVLCVVCFVPFPCDGNGLNYFNSILGIAEKDADLGGYLIGETEYVGGGYSAVLYPEGVISGEITRTTSRLLRKTKRKTMRPIIRRMRTAPFTSKRRRCSTART